MIDPSTKPWWTECSASSLVLFGPAFTEYVLMIDPITPMARTSSGKITPLWPKLA